MLDLAKLRKNKAAIEDLLTKSGSGQTGNGLNYISLMWEDGEMLARDKAIIDENSDIARLVHELNNFKIDKITHDFVKFAHDLKVGGPPQVLHFRCQLAYVTILICTNGKKYYVLNSLTTSVGDYGLGNAITVLQSIADTLERRYPE